MKSKLNFIAILVMLIVAVSMVGTKGEPMKVTATNSYKVIRVNGKIVFIKKKTDMKQGDLYVQGTALNFLNEQSRAAVINKLKGRCVLSPSGKNQPKILPATTNISSRSGALINKIDVNNHFKGRYLVLGKMELSIGKINFPQDDKNFFYLRYNYNSNNAEDEVVRKKLSHVGDKLILDKDEIFKVDGKSIPVFETKMSLYFMKDGESELLAEFIPVFPKNDELKSELEIILSEFDTKQHDKVVKELTSYLNEFYGKPQKDNLTSWLKTEFDI